MGSGDAAQNGVQFGFGAHGKATNNTISGNDYTPADFTGCGILAFKAGGAIGQTRSNIFSGNEQNVCNAGGGPSPFSPFNQRLIEYKIKGDVITTSPSFCLE